MKKYQNTMNNVSLRQNRIGVGENHVRLEESSFSLGQGPISLGQSRFSLRQSRVIIGLDPIISKLKYFFLAIILLFVSSISFAQVFPSLEPYFTFDTGSYENSNLAAHEMILTGISFSEYPQVDPSKYMGIYLELEKQVTAPSFRKLPEKERAEAVLTLMYEQKLKKYQKNQTKLTVMLEDGSYNCVSASVLYAALAKAAGLTVIGNRASDHCFCSVLIEGKYIDVETTNPMGFEPGSKKQISSSSRGTSYAIIPTRQYSGRHVISDRMLVSLISRNLSAFTMDKRDYNSSVAHAVVRLVFLQGEKNEPNNDSRADFDTVCANYAVDLQKSKKFLDSLLWMDAVISRWGDSDLLLKNYQDIGYNTILYYCKQNDTDYAQEIFNQRKNLFDAENTEIIGQMIFLSRIQEKISSTKDPNQKLTFLREQKKSPLASNADIQKQIDGQIENCHLQLIVDAANASDYLTAIEYAKKGLNELPKSTKIKSLLTQSENNYAVTVHNKFADLANAGKYQEAKKVVEEGLKLVPKNATLKNDLKRIEQMVR